jgi:hypothetical protein
MRSDPQFLEWRHLILRMHILTGQWLLVFDSDRPDRYEARDPHLDVYEDLVRANDRISQTAFEMARRVEGKNVGIPEHLGPDKEAA